MKTVLLIGLGRFGEHLCKYLYEMGFQVMVVDRNEKCINEILPYSTNAIIGDTTNPRFLETLGVKSFDICIVAMGNNFQSSLETTSLLKEMGAPLVVSRAVSDFHAKFLLKNGADKVIYPEKQMAKFTAVRYSSNNILDYFELGDGYSVAEIKVPDQWVGKTLVQLDVRKKYNINIIGIKEKDKLNVALSPDVRFEKDSVLLVIGKYEDISKWL